MHALTEVDAVTRREVVTKTEEVTSNVTETTVGVGACYQASQPGCD